MFLTSTIPCLLALLSTTIQAAEPGFRVVGYLPEYRAAKFDAAAAKLLTDIVVFSAQPTAEGGIDMARLARTPWEKLRMARTDHKVRLILCIGGWNRSDGFAAISASDEKRKKFAEAAVKACQNEELDGVDLDWEHPKGETEETNYGKLLAAMKEAFKPHGLVLSVTMAGWQKLTAKGYKAVDLVQVMAYDQGGKHATFEAAEEDVKKVTGGRAAAKVVLGLPFYGRGVKERNKVLTYREIVAKHHPEPGIDEVDAVYFNGPDTIRKKVAYAREKGLGGVMVWELGQDAEGEASLLRVVGREVERKRSRRYFHDARPSDAARGAEALARIGFFYDIEREAKKIIDAQKLDGTQADALPLKMRQERTLPKIQEFKTWLDAQAILVLPKSPIAQAINYARNHWEALLRFTQYGFLNIDNNASERAMRPAALGRKNFLFTGSDEGGRTTAVLYTMTQTCRRHGIDPFSYLQDVLTRLPQANYHELADLFPHRWAAAQRAQLDKPN